MKTGRTELKLYKLEYKLNVISGAHFTLKLKIWPVNVSWMGAKDMRIMGQNKLLYYSWHIKRHEQVFVGILCPPKFCKGNVEEPNRHYTHRRFSLYQRRFIDVTSFLKTACYKHWELAQVKRGHVSAFLVSSERYIGMQRPMEECLNRIFTYFVHSYIPGTWNSICHTVDIQYIVV